MRRAGYGILLVEVEIGTAAISWVVWGLPLYSGTTPVLDWWVRRCDLPSLEVDRGTAWLFVE